MQVYARRPLDIDKVEIPHGQVYIIPERCKGCQLCIEFCPKEVLRISGESNLKGYHYPELIPEKENNCVHCEFCTLICPEFAIFSLASDGMS